MGVGEGTLAFASAVLAAWMVVFGYTVADISNEYTIDVHAPLAIEMNVHCGNYTQELQAKGYTIKDVESIKDLKREVTDMEITRVVIDNSRNCLIDDYSKKAIRTHMEVSISTGKIRVYARRSKEDSSHLEKDKSNSDNYWQKLWPDDRHIDNNGNIGGGGREKRNNYER